MSAGAYLPEAIAEFKRCQRLAEKAIDQLGEDRFFVVPGEGDNSVAIIVKHMSGNMLSRWTDFLTTDGEKPGRNRDSEFVVQPGESRHVILGQWKAGWAALFATLASLQESDLSRSVLIRGESQSVLQAINRQMTHYAYHVGQIVYVAKHLTGPSWKSLSIPLGQSEAFNRSPTRYTAKP